METKDIFEQMALRYDTEERTAVSRTIAGEIRSKLPCIQGKTALDYGCGTGLVGFQLIDLFEQMLFVDTSEQMIKQVERKIKEAGITRARARCCDFMEEVPLDIKADYVILSQVLLHVRDYPLLLEKLYKTLNADGHLLIVDFDQNEHVTSDMVHHGFHQKDLVSLCNKIGFSAAETRTFYRGEKMFMNQDASLFMLDAKK